MTMMTTTGWHEVTRLTDTRLPGLEVVFEARMARVSAAGADHQQEPPELRADLYRVSWEHGDMLVIGESPSLPALVRLAHAEIRRSLAAIGIALGDGVTTLALDGELDNASGGPA